MSRNVNCLVNHGNNPCNCFMSDNKCFRPHQYICIKHDSSACNDCVGEMRALESENSRLRKQVSKLREALEWLIEFRNHDNQTIPDPTTEALSELDAVSREKSDDGGGK